MNRARQALPGLPLWLVTLMVVELVGRYRKLRNRPGNVSVRLRAASDDRWMGGNAVWVGDVFAFRRLPAAWRESVVRVTSATTRTPDGADAAELHKFEQPIIATFMVEGDEQVEVAAPASDQARLLGPFSAPAFA